MIVRDFIRFKLSDAINLPVETGIIPAEAPPEPSAAGDKLFETAPAQVSADSPTVSEHASDGKFVPTAATDGDPEGKTQPASAENPPSHLDECSTEERARTRKSQKRQRLAATPPDSPKPTDLPGAQL